MAKEKIIKNNVVWENFRLQEELNGFQGNLKIEDKKLNKKLQDRIIKVWFNAPIFIWLNDQKFYILDWHQRLQALSELSKRGYTLEWWKIPVVEILADTEIEAKERIMDYSSAYALFDIPVLQGRSQELDMEFTNIPELSLDTPSMGDDFDLPSDEIKTDIVLEIKTDIVLGDLFEIGEHRLLCGNSTDAEQVALLMNGEKADMVFTDPPYWMFLDTDYSWMKNDFKSIWKSNKFDVVKWDGEDFNPEFVLLPLREFSYCKEIFLRWADYYAEYIADVKNNWSWVVWDKSFSESENTDKMYWSNFELCRSKSKHKRELARIKRKWLFWMEKDDTKSRVHPTQKPAILAEWFFDKWGKDTKLVVDIFWGSWSTMVACHKTNRKCYMQEFDPKYCQVIIDRMIKLDPTLEIKKNWLSYNPISNG